MQERIATAVMAAEQEFWATIAKHFPEIKTGDLDPLTAANLSNSMNTATVIWLITNR